jgi:hypothetical protein
MLRGREKPITKTRKNENAKEEGERRRSLEDDTFHDQGG